MQACFLFAPTGSPKNRISLEFFSTQMGYNHLIQ